MLDIGFVINKNDIQYTITTTDAGVINMLKEGIEERVKLLQRLLSSNAMTEVECAEITEQLNTYKEYLKTIN